MDYKEEEMKPWERRVVTFMETTTAESEEERTDEQRERHIREECARNIDIMIQHETLIGLNQVSSVHVVGGCTSNYNCVGDRSRFRDFSITRGSQTMLYATRARGGKYVSGL